MSQNEFKVASHLEAPADSVWARAVTPEGINSELMPLVRMTLPRGVERLDPETVPIGRPIGRSWILLFGLIPIDYDDVTLVRMDPGRGFLERSPMLSQRLWEHERTIEPEGPEACRIIDRVRYEPRLPVPRGALTLLFRAVFRHRHRRLRRRFGGYLESVA
jgi:ligand-binding SRPBCC domain-containing protein